MSCAYRHAAARIATIAGIPPDLMLTAMDIARQRRVAFPDLPPDRLRTIAPLLGITPTCGNPQQVIARIQSALIALGTLHPTHLYIERWMAVAAALGVPDDHLPVPVHPEIMATVRAQWAAPPPNPAPDRTAKGLAALWNGEPIPTEVIDEAIHAGDRQAIVTWIAHGVWDDRFEAMCADLSDQEIGTIARAGVMPDTIVKQIAWRWWSADLPWDVFPLAMWDRVANPDIARVGHTRTAAMKLIRVSTLCDDRLITAAAQQAVWAAKVLIHRHDLCDDRLIAAVAKDEVRAHDVLLARHDLADDRLIAAVARNAACARNVLIKRHDLADDRLIEAVASKGAPSDARDVLLARHDLADDRLIAAVAKVSWHARDVLIARHDLRDDRLIAAVARNPWTALTTLCACFDLCDDRLIAAIANDATCSRIVLIERPDLRTNTRLLTAIARDRALVDSVLAQVPELRDHPILAAVRHADGTSG